MSPLEVSSVTKRFGAMTAVDDVSVSVAPGSTLGIVGESGSGKSTLVRLLLGLQRPDSGSISVLGTTLDARTPMPRSLRRHIQLVPQDPRQTLNPASTVQRSLEVHMAAMRIPRAQRRSRAEAVLDQVALSPDFLHAYPGELSGGQAQRIAIARALVGEPEIVVCDEAVSALDRGVQAQVLNLLAETQRARGITLVFVSHDLAVVEHISDEIVVLRRGRLIEAGPTARVLHAPQAEYTRELLSARSQHRTAPHTP